MEAGKAVPCCSVHVQLHIFTSISDKEQRACLVLQDSSHWRMRVELRTEGSQKRYSKSRDKCCGPGQQPLEDES